MASKPISPHDGTYDAVVVFAPGRGEKWWQQFTGHPFNHCALITREEGQLSLLEWALDDFSAGPVDPERVDVISRWVALQNGVVLGMNWVQPRPIYRTPILFMTCASLIAERIGLPRGCWTPHQLYRTMLRHGAAFVRDYRKEPTICP